MRNAQQKQAMEMTGCGKHGKPKAGFPPFPHPLEIPAGFPHYHGYGDDYHLSEDRQSPPKTRNQSHSHRKGLVNHLPGLKRKGSPGTLTPCVERNPIKLVRQSAKRERVPDVLELAELPLLLSKLSIRERTLALLDAATGLRVSELLALRWSDVNFENLELSVTRSIWHHVVGNCKTEASAKPVPIDSHIAEDLLRWRRQSPYPMAEDYIFASPTMKGAQPYWPDNLMKRYIKPVARKAGIHKNIGWHTFRHSFGTLLKANGEDVKTVQELLRPANSKITLEVYTPP
jgi:integrase